MEFKSFKELLLKKASGDDTLQTIISMMRDDILADKLLESLEKMAKPQASMGRSANSAVTAFGNQLKNKDVEMMRDALAHHINHYRAALKNGNRAVADAHLNKIIPMMHLAARAGAHSNGQLGLDYVPLEPWETNYTTTERRPETGKLKEGTKGLRRRLNSASREKNPRSVPDYRYLEMPPHEEHSDSKKSPHKGGYPFEEIQLGSPAKIDNNEAYLDLHDVDPKDQFTPHAFDQHPIHKYSDAQQSELSDEHMNDFANNMTNWHGSEHNAKWLNDLKQQHANNPEAFKAKGKVKPAHHYEGINLLQQPHKPNVEMKQESVAAPQQAAPKPTQNINYSVLPPELRAKLGVK